MKKYYVQSKNEDQAKIIQDLAFKNGYSWVYWGSKYKNLSAVVFTFFDGEIRFTGDVNNVLDIEISIELKLKANNKISKKLHKNILFENEKYILVE